MKFTSKMPKKDGYYWLVEMEYPIPKIVWYSAYYKTYWDWGREVILDNNIHYKFGDKIEEPDCRDNEYG